MKLAGILILVTYAAFPLWGFEDSILRMLNTSFVGQESVMAFQIANLQARNRLSLTQPDLYIAAPNAYEIQFQSGTTQSIQSQIGLRGQLFGRVLADLSISHGLTYRSGVPGVDNMPNSGFLQTFSGRLIASTPLIGETTRPTNIFLNSLAISESRLLIAQNNLVRQFISDWFEVYRQNNSLLVLQEQINYARLVVETFRVQYEQQTRPLYEYWQAQRNLTALELELVQAETATSRSIHLFEAIYGIEIPDLTKLPSDISWMNLGIKPRLLLEIRLAGAIDRTARQEYLERRKDLAPQLTLVLGMTSPQPNRLESFSDSLQQPFSSLRDWTGTLGIGFSLSSNTLVGLSQLDTGYDLEGRKRIITQEGELTELLSQKRQLERLAEQYRQMVTREEESLYFMEQYLEDVQSLAQIGYSQLELAEISLELFQMQSLLTRTRSHLREVELHLELLGAE